MVEQLVGAVKVVVNGPRFVQMTSSVIAPERYFGGCKTSVVVSLAA
jgi:hypothetical protein